MSVSIDETGQDEGALGIDCLRSSVPGFKFVAWSDCDDGVTLHDHRAVLDDGSGCVHGHNRASSDEQIGFFFAGLRRYYRTKEREGDDENDRSRRVIGTPRSQKYSTRGFVAPPSRRLSWGRPARRAEGEMPSGQPARCRRYEGADSGGANGYFTARRLLPTKSAGTNPKQQLSDFRADRFP